MTIDKVRAALGGISGVHVTPYDVDGAVDKTQLARVIDRIAMAGIHNIVSAGNTGEYLCADARRSPRRARRRDRGQCRPLAAHRGRRPLAEGSHRARTARQGATAPTR